MEEKVGKIEKTPEEIRRGNSINFAKKVQDGMRDIDEVRKSETTRLQETRTIKSALNDPFKNSKILQQQAEIMRVLNGTLKGIEFYKANIMTCDNYLLPIDASKYIGKEDLFFKDMRKAALELEKYQLKVYCPWIIENVIRKGEIYTYFQKSDDMITISKFPEDMCKMTYSQGFMMGYSIDLSKIKDKQLGFYPQAIQDVYTRYKTGKLNAKDKKRIKDQYWYRIELNEGVAFSDELLEQKGIPYYSGLLLDLNRIKDLNDLNMDDAKASNFKLLHHLIPSDDEGNITVDFDEALAYHEAVKAAVCEGIGVVSSPYEINPITLQNNTSKNFDYLTKLKNEVYNAAGVDSSLFNSENRSSAQSVVYSAIVDTLLAKSILNKIAVWLNFMFKNDSALKKFKLKFVETSVYDQEAKIQSLSNRLASFDSKLEYFATKGYTPLEALSTLQLEGSIDFGKYMTPLANAHTMNTGEDNGRPKTTDEDPNKAPEDTDTQTTL